MKAYDALGAQLVTGFDQFFQGFAREEAACFLAGLGQQAMILDLGCGAGPASRYFAEHGHTAISADLSTAMLTQCLQRGLKELVRLDLQAVPFARRCFDGIWAHTCLLHIPKAGLRGAMRSLAVTLKPEGKLFVALREGKGEGYVGQPGLERWFASFLEAEFEAYIPGDLSIMRRTRTKLGSTTFLSYHMRLEGQRRHGTGPGGVVTSYANE